MQLNKSFDLHQHFHWFLISITHSRFLFRDIDHRTSLYTVADLLTVMVGNLLLFSLSLFLSLSVSLSVLLSFTFLFPLLSLLLENPDNDSH